MANLTDSQLAELERLADAATPLEQRFMTDQMPPCEDYPTPFVAFSVGDERRVVNLGTVGTATFAVAANPKTVKAVIADLREARRLLEEAVPLLVWSSLPCTHPRAEQLPEDWWDSHVRDPFAPGPASNELERVGAALLDRIDAALGKVG